MSKSYQRIITICNNKLYHITAKPGLEWDRILEVDYVEYYFNLFSQH